LDELNPNRT